MVALKFNITAHSKLKKRYGKANQPGMCRLNSLFRSPPSYLVCRTIVTMSNRNSSPCFVLFHFKYSIICALSFYRQAWGTIQHVPMHMICYTLFARFSSERLEVPSHFVCLTIWLYNILNLSILSLQRFEEPYYHMMKDKTSQEEQDYDVHFRN